MSFVGRSFGDMAAVASGWVAKVGKATVSVIAPSTGPAADATAGAISAAGTGAQAIGKGVGDGAKAVGDSVKKVLGAAGSGVKTGFQLGTFLIVLLLGLYLMGLFRNATGGGHA